MPHRFCAVCGKVIDNNAPHFSMCLNCYLKEHPLFELPDDFTLKVCIDCGNYSKKEEWFASEENDIFLIIQEAIKNHLLKSYLKKDIIDFIFSFDEKSFTYSSRDLLNSVELNIKGFLKEDDKISSQQKLKVKINYELCKNCSNLRGGTYFLSIIQLRVKDDSQFDLIKETLDYIQSYVERVFQKDNKHYISKIEDQKNGVDLFLSTNEIMNHIVSYLKSEYHFILKRSKKLVGRDIQKGRNLYRLKTLIKLLPIKKNDIILINKQNLVVENITKNKVILRREDSTKITKDFSYFFNEKFSIIRSMEER